MTMIDKNPYAKVVEDNSKTEMERKTHDVQQGSISLSLSLPRGRRGAKLKKHPLRRSFGGRVVPGFLFETRG